MASQTLFLDANGKPYAPVPVPRQPSTAPLLATEWCGNPANNIHRFANTLWAIIMALTAEVQENERLYPELKDTFDRERAEYRSMKSAADEADSLE